MDNNLNTFLTKTFHPSLHKTIEKAWDFFSDKTRLDIENAIEGDEINSSTIKLYIMTKGVDDITSKLKTYGIITKGLPLEVLADCVSLVSGIESKSTPEETVEVILNSNSVEEGFALAVSNTYNTNYEDLLSYIVTIKDEFGVWVYEQLVEYGQVEPPIMQDRSKVLSVLSKLPLSNSVGEFIVKVNNVELGLEPVAYIHSLDEEVLAHILESKGSIASHIASLFIVSDVREKEWDDKTVEVITTINNFSKDVILEDIRDRIVIDVRKTMEELIDKG